MHNCRGLSQRPTLFNSLNTLSPNHGHGFISFISYSCAFFSKQCSSQNCLERLQETVTVTTFGHWFSLQAQSLNQTNPILMIIKLTYFSWFLTNPQIVPRASKRRVLLIIVGVCHHILSSHLLIFTSSHLTSSHLLILTSSHLHIFSSSHLLIFSSSHRLIFTPSHLHIFSLLPSCPLLSPSFLLLS